jgi:ATP-dependent Clp protease ATP-binding subunit ClpA
MSEYGFSERVRKVLAMAQDESAALNHEYVGTEHLLLALIHEGSGVAVAALQNLRVDLREVERLIRDTVKPGPPGESHLTHDRPFTSRAKKCLELAMASARDLDHNYVSTEHLLLGIIREEKGIAAQVLAHVGAKLRPVSDEIVRLLGTVDASQANPVPAAKGMTGYSFTERVRKVLAMSREDAAALHHGYVGTEHLLLAMIREGEGVGTAVLQNLNVDLEKAARIVRETIEKGMATQATGPDLPYTSRAKKVLELAMTHARELNHSYVGTEHLLLGLIAEEKGIAAQTLAHAGVTLHAAREEVLRLLGTPAAEAQAISQRAEPPAGVESRKFSSPVASIAMQVRLENGVVLREQFTSVLQAIAYLSRQST